MTDGVGEAFVAEIRRQGTFVVLSYDELKAVLSHEQLTQLVGCDDPACLANIGSAAGAGALASGTLGKVGTSWVVSLKIIDVSAVRVVSTANRRLKGASIDDVLDQIPAMVGELVQGASGRIQAPANAAPQPVASVSNTTAPAPLPSARREKRFEDAAVIGRLEVYTDGKGHYIAFDPTAVPRTALFAGSRDVLYQQDIVGGGRSGKGQWSATLWEPRVLERWRGTFDFKPEGTRLFCGDEKIPYQAASAADVAAVRTKSKLFVSPWTRTAVHLARDSNGQYYYVDKAAAPRGNNDYRLFIGTKGHMEYVPLTDSSVDFNGAVFISGRGRLVMRKQDGKDVAAWAVGESEQAVSVMNLWQQTPMVYTELGAYTGQALGTACDPILGR
jgi:hypothetical protein